MAAGRGALVLGIGLLAGLTLVVGLPTPGIPRGRVERPGIHNVFRLDGRLFSGSSPEGDTGFASLRRLGIRTILSVDGARPDVERARRQGLRYVHLPIGYDGVPEAQGLRLAKAVRDLPGPIYLHCHHGKHRGPAAAAVIRRCLDPRCSTDSLIQEMRRAGTDPRYTGLYASARTWRLGRDRLETVDDSFPEIAMVPALAQAMVEIDLRWDHLKEVRAAGWSAPPGHPDIDPVHEALQLRELYHESARQREQSLSDPLREALKAAEGHAERLRQALDDPKATSAIREAAFQANGAACTSCHARHRDPPRPH